MRSNQLLRLIWFPIMGLYLMLYGFSLAPMMVHFLKDAHALFGSDLAQLGLTGQHYAIFFLFLNSLYPLVALLVSVVIFWKRGHDNYALIVSLALLGIQVHFGRSPIALAEANPDLILWIDIARMSSSFFTLWTILAFPDGRFVPSWGKSLLFLLCIPNFIASDVRWYLHTSRINPLALVTLVTFIIGFLFQAYRYLKNSSPLQKQQGKWVMSGISISLVSMGVFLTLDVLQMPYMFNNSMISLLYRVAVNTFLIYLPLVFIPISIAISLFRYRLWDIDLVINRSLVVLGVVFVLISAFSLVLWLLLLVFQGTPLALAIVISAFVVVPFFNRVRYAIQNLIDKRFYRWRFNLDQFARAMKEKAPTKGVWTGQVIQGYQVEEILGQGGMGEVYRVTQQSKTYALKTILAKVSEETIHQKRFQLETTIMKRLHHPNIVQYHADGQQDGRPYLVLEWVQGTDLQNYIKENTRLSVKESLEVLEGLASALEYSHAQGIVHCDLKPANIFITLKKDGGSVHPVLGDFGIAKWLEAEALPAGVGTILYMAPEQILSAHDVDRRADIYSLGVMLFQMVVGETPFKGASSQLIFAHLQQPPPNPCDIVPEIPPVYGQAILKALAKDPKDRWQTISEMLGQLKQGAIGA